jgi:hypothetical protein
MTYVACPQPNRDRCRHTRSGMRSFRNCRLFPGPGATSFRKKRPFFAFDAFDGTRFLKPGPRHPENDVKKNAPCNRTQIRILLADKRPPNARRTKDKTIRSVVKGSSFRNPTIACPSEIGFEPKKARNELQRRKLKERSRREGPLSPPPLAAAAARSWFPC